MSEHVDIAIVGAGTGGEVCAHQLARAGRKVAVIERELIGGECDYWACMPSKALIRPAALLSQIDLGVGLARPDLRWDDMIAFRDEAVQHLDDTPQVEAFAREGILFIRGNAHLDGPGRVVAGERILEATDIVIATGTEPRVPPVEGLRESGFWTNRDVTLLRELPESIAILGGSAQALEMGAMLSQFGVEVAIIQRSERLLGREDAALGTLIAGYLRDMGITLYLGQEAARVSRDADGGRRIRLKDGSQVVAREVLVAAGREPRVENLGLETAGIRTGKRGIEIDEYCRAAPHLWAVGDITGIALFTHVANYQARVVADNILGREHPANYSAIPRVVFTQPEIAAVGLTPAQAQEQGIDLAVARLDLRDTISRPTTYGRRTSGTLTLLADRKRGVLVGAWAVAPEAAEWIHVPALAIRAGVPLTELRDMIYQFPTFSESLLYATEQLAV